MHIHAIIIFIQGGWTPLMAASFHGHVDIVKTLINAKAQINKQRQVYICVILFAQKNTHRVLYCMLCDCSQSYIPRVYYTSGTFNSVSI